MSLKKSSSPLIFLHLSDFNDLEDLIEKPEILKWRIARHIVDNLFHDRWGNRVDLPPTATAEMVPQLKTTLAWFMAGDLLDAVSAKLTHHYPHGPAKHRRIALLEQALSYLNDVWVEAFAKFPRDPLPRRCQRILPMIKQWPKADMRGRPQHGNTSQLTYLIFFEDVMKALKGLPRRPHNGYEEKQRRAFLDGVLYPVRSVPGRAGSRFFHPETKEIFFEIPDIVFERELTRWVRKLSRKEIALEITALIVTRTGGNLTSKTLCRLLPKLRAQRQRIDRALSR